MTAPETKSLKKQLKLLDVYVISTGAMFSSGFLLLPGLAAAQAGPAVVLAYLLAGLLILPAMLSQAELSTAMPRAGGSYYFLDRTMGPLVGTIGGMGTWLALMLKSSFALIGMGAYIAIYLDVPIIPIAISFSVVFALLNIFGAKESTRVLRVLVVTVLGVIIFFVVHGVVDALLQGLPLLHRTRFTPFMPTGVDGLLATVGLVFVSFIGLTNVASLAEEVTEPDRNIPLGMMLALATVIPIYVLGVYVLVAVLGTETLSGSLTPVADAAAVMFTWIPHQLGVAIVVAAAIGAFASMSNAGILAASRYPLAMARDRIVPEKLAHLGRFHTPTRAILLTVGVVILLIVTLDVLAVAKLASATQLLMFALLNVAVIVMRESQIEAYDPGFRSPLYPWVQLAGMIIPFVLIAEMGWLPVLFTIALAILSIAWYKYYAQAHIERDGAIYHVFERLGRRRFGGLDQELREIMKEKGARAEDPFDEVVTDADVIDLDQTADLDDVIARAASLLQRRLPTSQEKLAEGFGLGDHGLVAPLAHGVALFHTRLPDLPASALALVRLKQGIRSGGRTLGGGEAQARAAFFLVSGEADPGMHLRILSQLAVRTEDSDFLKQWEEAEHEQDLKEVLLRDDRFLRLVLEKDTKTEPLIGRALKDISMPEGSLIALIHRYGKTIVPRGRTRLEIGDRLTIIGDPDGLDILRKEYMGD